MRKFLVVSIPIVTIALFILIMLSESFLKYPLNDDDNIPLSIDNVKKEIDNEKWDEAKVKTDLLSGAWDKVVARVQFSAEKTEIDGFYFNIARLYGAIEANDKSSALMELNEAYAHWENIGN